ncbi:helix-turn-helix transcriptional regulator [Enterobacter cloacae subsp. cloacae]
MQLTILAIYLIQVDNLFVIPLTCVVMVAKSNAVLIRLKMAKTVIATRLNIISGLIITPFLVEGIRHHFGEVNDKYISQPVVIIDFSHKNINYFLSENWLDQFKNMRLILVTDKKMTAIAHYWFYNDTLETTISSIIFYDDSAEEVSTKLKKTFLAKTIKPTGNRPKLSQNEYSLFSFLFNGWSPKKIAYRNGTSVKNTYAMKNRIERKLGVSITRLAS